MSEPPSVEILDSGPGPGRPARQWLLYLAAAAAIGGLIAAAIVKGGRHEHRAAPPSPTQGSSAVVPAPKPDLPLRSPAAGAACGTNCRSYVQAPAGHGPAGLLIGVAAHRSVTLIDAATGRVTHGPALPEPDSYIVAVRRIATGWLLVGTSSGSGTAYFADGRHRPVALGMADGIIGPPAATWLARTVARAGAVAVRADGTIGSRVDLYAGQQPVGATRNRLEISTTGRYGETRDGQSIGRLVIHDPNRHADDLVIPDVYCPLAAGDHTIAWTSLSGTVNVLDTDSGRRSRIARPSAGDLPCYGALSTDGKRLSVGTYGVPPGSGLRSVGKVYAIDLTTKRVTRIPGIGLAPNRQASMFWSGRVLVIGVPGDDRPGVVALWDTAQRNLVRVASSRPLPPNVDVLVTQGPVPIG